MAVLWLGSDSCDSMQLGRSHCLLCKHETSTKRAVVQKARSNQSRHGKYDMRRHDLSMPQAGMWHKKRVLDLRRLCAMPLQSQGMHASTRQASWGPLDHDAVPM